MTVKIMKGIAGLGRRLISVLLVLVVSSLMFLTSPAIALGSNTVTLNEDNFETEVWEFDKIVVMLLTPNKSPEALKAKLKSEVEKTYGDKYKIVIGSVEENADIYHIPVPKNSQLLPLLTALKNGQLFFVRPIVPSNTRVVFELLNLAIEDS